MNGYKFIKDLVGFILMMTSLFIMLYIAAIVRTPM